MTVVIKILIKTQVGEANCPVGRPGSSQLSDKQPCQASGPPSALGKPRSGFARLLSLFLK